MNHARFFTAAGRTRKNGNLLLNVPRTPEGEPEEETVTMLADMGRYLDLIGEAVFSTRPWEVFGEGAK
jgi:alpha-L-fucosidase